MLIKCPECNKEISDKACICINCGFPIQEDDSVNMCLINNQKIDLSEELELITKTDYMQGLRNLRDKTGLGLADEVVLADIIKQTNSIPKEYKSSDRDKYKQELAKNEKRSIPQCPTCQSTDIYKMSGLETGASVAVLGIFSRKINKTFKCKHCGYMW